jgi:hypothetical protein
MVGTIAFNLDPPDGHTAKSQMGFSSLTPPDAEPEVMVRTAVPAPPRLPYAPVPGSYTQLWTSLSATMTAEEMKNEMKPTLAPSWVPCRTTPRSKQQS